MHQILLKMQKLKLAYGFRIPNCIHGIEITRIGLLVKTDLDKSTKNLSNPEGFFVFSDIILISKIS
jgi:hypothetical protein